jgi:site-specific DNA recombinase
VKIPRRDGVPAHAEIQEAEAVVVRRIFDAYVSRDLTVRQIAKQLTLERTPTPRNGGGQWSWSAVDRILHEEAYIGTYYYNRKQCVPIEGVYGKKRQRFKCTLRPKDEWIPISVPSIIDLATFHAAAGRARENDAFSPRNLQEGGYLLRKLVRCGRCGCSCSALTSKQTYGGKVHSSHYYGCLRTSSGFLKQERCSQRRIRDVLDELVWEEVSTRLQAPALVLEAYQDHNTRQKVSTEHDGATGKDDRLKEQIKLANRELSRLLDAYQCGVLELPELQKRRQLVNSKIEMLNREQELLSKVAAETKKETDIKASLEEFAALVSNNLKRISFENKQKLLRIVLDKIVVNDWKVAVYYNIPLPKPTPPPAEKVSTKFDLRSTCRIMLSST